MSRIDAVGLLDEAAGYADMEGEHEFAEKLRKAGTDVYRLVERGKLVADLFQWADAGNGPEPEKAMRLFKEALLNMEPSND